jgi:nitrate reductase NapE component
MFSHVGPYLSSSIIALAIGGIVVATLFRPLFAVVADLCGTRQRALFWTVYLSIVMILIPLLGVAFVSTYGARAVDAAAFVERGIIFALLGLTGAVLAIGWGIWGASNRAIEMQQRANAAAQTSPAP